jgi:membrane protein implicated in regulation of membrane protease activity
MDLSMATVWWLAAGFTVIVELSTGTLYLLFIALGLAAGAVAAHLGGGLSLQMLTAAALGSGVTLAWHFHQRRQPSTSPVRENKDVNLDVGAHVTVTAWASDQTARVSYRGSAWTARLKPGSAAVPGTHVVVAVEGNWLVLEPKHSNRTAAH